MSFSPITPSQAQDTQPDPDLQTQIVPHGTVTHFIWKTSRVYPGTQHDCTVYVPAQYDPAKPACVMVFQDGLGFNAPTVFDNLIAKKQMPVTIAIGVNPGVAPPAGSHPQTALARYNRSVEYDTPDGTYARFLLEEILPEVGKHYTLSQDPNDRGLCGASSGGIAAFTAAWERPDQFRRVYSVIGSFTDLCGGNTYPSQIRKYEPKPLRIYLQDNDHDLDIYSGNWPLANQEIAAALKYAGYDSEFTVGQGGHDGRPGSLIFPQVLRWLWRDYPAPITAASAFSHQSVMQFLLPQEGWQQVRGANAVFLASDLSGNLVFTGTDHTLTRLDGTGKKVVSPLGGTPVYGMTLAPDGRVIVSSSKGLMQYGKTGVGRLLAGGVTASALTTDHAGNLYFAEKRGGLWSLPAQGRKHQVAEGQYAGSCLALSPDQSLLVTPGGGPRKSLLSWRVQSDGTLTDAEPFFDLYTPYSQPGPQPAAMVFDTQGWLYVATPAGIQICDQAGRVNGILSLPERAIPTGLTWGGPARDTLYLACGGTLYKRRLHSTGVLPMDAPMTPPAPHL